ncbi:MAG: uracil-DNA glycosylase family protein [Candidatus Hermodarchaeota archaeon]
MNIANCISCQDFPCEDINKESYVLPNIEIDSSKIKLLMISEAPPTDSKDYFYASNSPFYMETTLNAFKDAGITVSSIKEIINKGFYLTTAIKCGKTGYKISVSTIKTCSHLLEKELSFFPNIRVFLLMGDVAIKAFNYIAKRTSGKKAIPSGSTYKIRKAEFYYEDKRVFPSYLQTGKNYLIEKSKRTMIAEDIKNALALIE